MQNSSTNAPRVYFHPYPFECLQGAKFMLQVFEYDHTMRRIYTDGRPLVHGSGSNWMEYSVGIGKAITASLSIPWIQRELFRAKFAVVEQGSINIVREIRNETRGRSANEDTTRGQ